MKKILFTLMFCASVITQAQHTNAVYLSLLPVNMGGGVRIDQQFKSMGIYGSFQYGNYKLADVTFIQRHYKATGGIILPLAIQRDGCKPAVLLGASYNIYNGVLPMVRRSFLFPLSIEVGISNNINHFVGGIRIDVIKREVSVDMGWKFNLIHL